MIVSRFNHGKYDASILEDQSRGDIINLLARQRETSVVTTKNVGNIYEKFAGDNTSGMNKKQKKEYARLNSLITFQD
jgi:hypothetical protein